VRAPTLLPESHQLDQFSCGRPVLDDWLKKRARSNHASGASRTYVVAEEARVVGYFCISSGAMNHADAPGSIRRNMPDPVPMAIIGRLAVDQGFQCRGIGPAMLRDAVQRIALAAEIMGVRGILVQALDEKARTFYEAFGFTPSATNPMILTLSLKRPT
jgi:predicted N-acetyltransferase YhbS